MVLELIPYGVHKMFRIEHNVQTDEITQIELTVKEISYIEANEAAQQAANAAQQAEADAAATAKAALLKKLGITAEEAKLLLS